MESNSASIAQWDGFDLPEVPVPADGAVDAALIEQVGLPVLGAELRESLHT